MPKDTCKIEDCATPRISRGLCSSHYQKFRTAGTLDDHADPPFAWRSTGHRLTEVDTESRTAICDTCGPTEIRVRPGHSNQCMTLRREQRWGKGGRAPSSEARLRWKYRLTADEYARLMARAGGRCELCGVDISEGQRIDHCHETGLVRGILCHRCNIGLGWFDDDPARLLAAHLYLKATGKAEGAA